MRSGRAPEEQRRNADSICLYYRLPVGLWQSQSRHLDARISTAAIDPELNEFGHIVPGLGDAGDVGGLHVAT